MLTKFELYEKLFSINEMVGAEQVDQKALNKIRRCFTQIITNYGFFAELLFNLNMMEAHPDSDIKTMATDGKSIAYSAKFVHELDEAEVIFVIIHEIMHNANFHFSRMKGKDPQIWNCAADYAINLQIDDMRKDLNTPYIKPPKKILLDEKWRGMDAEMIYDELTKNQKQQKQQQGQGQPGQGQPGKGQPGQGQPGQGQAGGTPEGDIRKPGSLDGKGTTVYEGNKDISESETGEELEKAWTNVRNNAAAKNAGTGSASLDRWLRKLNKPRINWRAELKKFVAQVYDELDYAYSNKRFIWQDMHLPGPQLADKSSYQNVVIAIDTSGSIGDDTLAKFATEMLKLFKQYSIYTCYVIWCDDRIPGYPGNEYKKGGVQKFDIADGNFKLEKLQPKGGGGTSFHPPFEWVQQNILKKGKVPAFMVYFTDAYGDAPNVGQYNLRNYANRVLWVITENDDASNIKFGKKIYIDKLAT